ncbi:hypothetical protein XAP6164_3790002 [Xanthomonas phaseoli pv. phaseoli]|nr:hypothetical protein XAP6164_3790002 [Xanthomonas phaseoli pv. phaseoli]
MVAGWVIDGCRLLHSRARKDYSAVHAARIEGRQESAKKLFTNSKLSHFWLFFARIPANPDSWLFFTRPCRPSN